VSVRRLLFIHKIYKSILKGDSLLLLVIDSVIRNKSKIARDPNNLMLRLELTAFYQAKRVEFIVVAIDGCKYVCSIYSSISYLPSFSCDRY
jgi:hypothetical protein